MTKYYPSSHGVVRAALCMATLAITARGRAAEPGRPLAGEGVVLLERNGLVAVEAEHFAEQRETARRAWYLTNSTDFPHAEADGDPPHVGGASGGAYLEILPDTRRTHDDKLIRGENFSPQPGKMAVLSYNVHFTTPGRYYVWVRAYSTGGEDNGLHVGLDGEWPESGQRMQWCQGKRSWRWESRQRTNAEHCGVPHAIYLDIEEPGEHVVSFSMREDGFEFDKWLLTIDRDLARPEGLGPETRVKSGMLPEPFAYVEAKSEPAGTRAPKPDTPPTSRAVNVGPRGENGDGTVTISGETKQWHPVTLTLNGPFAHEQDSAPNPFTDHRMTVTFTHEGGKLERVVPGYFAADGRAANSSAEAGTGWRAHLSPDLPGKWNYEIAFTTGEQAALDADAKSKPVAPYDGQTGSFEIAATDKTGRDLRAKGRLEYVGERYLRFAGNGETFLKVGPDSPETFLGSADFDGTSARRKNVPLKSWEPHVRDWRVGDPTWNDGRGKGLIGALNYLAEQGCNSFSFMPYNGGGDGDNVWPFTAYDAKRNYDCSKLDQWGIVLDHAQNRGLYLHFKLQEQENDDDGRAALDGGDLGPERKLYCRELVARYGHLLALNWNLGEENTQSPEQQRAMATYLRDVDPYDHHIVVHTFPNAQDEVYSQLLGEKSVLTGASLQNSWDAAHRRTAKWVRESTKAGKPWVVCNDEQGPALLGVPPDPGYAGHDGFVEEKGRKYDLHDIRKLCLWGTLMAGGGGVEYYFGYKLPQNDLVCEDFRSREQSWRYGRIALDFFADETIPVAAMNNHDELIGNASHSNDRFCLAKPGETYLVYLPEGGSTALDLAGVDGEFTVAWFNPREGGTLVTGGIATVRGGKSVHLGEPPYAPGQDWLVVVRNR